MKKFFACVAFYSAISSGIYAQTAFPYTLELVPVEISGLPGLHSYAWAQHEGKWLVLGGRKDGLHSRQPFNSFPGEENNTAIYVIDPEGKQFWASEIANLPTSIREQIQSTNMNFHQDAETLYFLGGYAYAASLDTHITFPHLTRIDVPGLINAVVAGEAIDPYFEQIQDDRFAVSGGHLDKLHDLFYLVGGHRFDGTYNPMGHPTFSQEYTNQIRTFGLEDTEGGFRVADYSSITDELHLHRRDYNLLPQIFPDREEGFTISSGVFQVGADLPFLYPVDIRESSHTPLTDFNQYLSNYHSAVALMYDSLRNEMHSIFFGGMSQYYYQDGQLIQDDLVPFVKTISRLSRDASGALVEYQLEAEMPGLQGASAEFFPSELLPYTTSGILKLNLVEADTISIGHIYGGLESPSLNPFTNNLSSSTWASSTIYEVRLIRNLANGWIPIDAGRNPLNLHVYPNPSSTIVNIEFELVDAGSIHYFISNLSGQILFQSPKLEVVPGKNRFSLNTSAYRDKFLLLTLVLDGRYMRVVKLGKQ